MLFDGRHPQIIAHRGFSGRFPENTLAAIDAAIDLGVDMVEVDVQLSRDGIPVICHNDRIDKTSNGQGSIREMTVDQLKTLDVGSWKDVRFAGERMPTLDEALQCARGRVRLNLDIKNQDALLPTLDALRSYRMMDSVVLSGCTWRQVLAVREEEAHLPVLLNVDRMVGILAYNGWKRTALALLLFQSRLSGAIGINLVHRYVTPEVVNRSLRVDKPVWTWTVNSPKRAQTLTEMGVASITSNHPDRILLALAT